LYRIFSQFKKVQYHYVMSIVDNIISWELKKSTRRCSLLSLLSRLIKCERMNKWVCFRYGKTEIKDRYKVYLPFIHIKSIFIWKRLTTKTRWWPSCFQKVIITKLFYVHLHATMPRRSSFNCSFCFFSSVFIGWEHLNDQSLNDKCNSILPVRRLFNLRITVDICCVWVLIYSICSQHDRQTIQIFFISFSFRFKIKLRIRNNKFVFFVIWLNKSRCLFGYWKEKSQHE